MRLFLLSRVIKLMFILILLISGLTSSSHLMTDANQTAVTISKSESDQPYHHMVGKSRSLKQHILSPWYGRYVGPTKIFHNKHPIDQMDAVAKAHDQVYQQKHFGIVATFCSYNQSIIKADAIVVRDSFKAIFINRYYDAQTGDFTGPQSLKGRVVATVTFVIFTGLTLIKTIGYVADTIHFYVGLIPNFRCGVAE